MVEGTEGSHHKGGSTKMAKRTTICAGIDTGKRKLDIALDGSSEQLQIGNTPEGYKTLSDWLWRLRAGCCRRAAAQGICRGGVSAGTSACLCQVPPATGQERQDRCRSDRGLHRRGQDDPCPARCSTAAVRRASDHDRSDRRGYRAPQESPRDLPQPTIPADLEGGYRQARKTRENRAQSSGGGDPRAS